MERTNSSVKWGSVQLPLAPNPIQNAKKYHCVCVEDSLTPGSFGSSLTGQTHKPNSKGS